MSAAQQVFDTYEPLEMIICQVKPPQIRELRSVNKTWQSISSTSKAIRCARIVKTYTPFEPFKGIDMHTLTGWHLRAATLAYASCRGVTPWYSALHWLRINPVFEHVSSQGRKNPKLIAKLRIKIVLPKDDHPLEYFAAATQYATEPPCNAIQVATHFFDEASNGWCSPRESTVCLAYNKDGLKVGDLLAARDLVHATHMRVRVRDPSDYGITAILTVRGVVPGMASFAEKARSARYFDLLPRYRRASYQPGRELREANERDLAMVWKPGKK